LKQGFEILTGQKGAASAAAVTSASLAASLAAPLAAATKGFLTSVPALAMPDVIVEEQQASGTGGGASTSGAWFTRVLNTLVRNIGSIASLATNQVTLGAGTYYFSWSSPCGLSDQHQSRLINASDGLLVGYGSSEYSISTSPSVTTRSVGGVVVTIAAPKTFRIEHRVATSSANTGALGVGNSFGGTNVYSHLEITKLA
jgi:hypothetical protein